MVPTPPPELITIGWTGLRGDGRDRLQEICQRRGWIFNGSTAWLDTPEEVIRLSRSTLIVLWYFASDRGQSLALSTACAAGRPILINRSKMFGMADELDGWQVWRARPDEDLESAILRTFNPRLWVRPTQLATVFSWPRALQRMEASWRQR